MIRFHWRARSCSRDGTAAIHALPSGESTAARSGAVRSVRARIGTEPPNGHMSTSPLRAPGAAGALEKDRGTCSGVRGLRMMSTGFHQDCKSLAEIVPSPAAGVPSAAGAGNPFRRPGDTIPPDEIRVPVPAGRNRKCVTRREASAGTAVRKVTVVVDRATCRSNPSPAPGAAEPSPRPGPAGSWGHERPIGWRCLRALPLGSACALHGPDLHEQYGKENGIGCILRNRLG